MQSCTARHLLAGIAAIVAVDLGSKLAAPKLATVFRDGSILPVENHELSLGVAGSSWFVMIGLGAIAIALAVVMSVRAINDDRVALWIPAALIGGALANVVDRAMFGAVHDFIATPWIIFNFADVAVLAAIAGLIARRSRAEVVEGVKS